VGGSDTSTVALPAGAAVPAALATTQLRVRVKLAGVAVRPIIRASKYSMTSVKRLKIER